jgi:uncharacterized protein YegL
MKDATEIVVVLDRSGSMESVRTDAIGGFNTFLKEQKAAPGEANLRIVLFDDKYETLYNGPLRDAPELTERTFVPRGLTALHDAMAKAVVETGMKLDALPEHEKPDKVIFVTLTDGYENASREYNQQSVRDMVTHQEEKYSWKFVYLAAGQDAVLEAEKLGVTLSCDYLGTAQGTASAYKGISRGVLRFRADADDIRASNFTPDPTEDDSDEDQE